MKRKTQNSKIDKTFVNLNLQDIQLILMVLPQLRDSKSSNLIKSKVFIRKIDIRHNILDEMSLSLYDINV